MGMKRDESSKRYGESMRQLNLTYIPHPEINNKNDINNGQERKERVKGNLNAVIVEIADGAGFRNAL